MRILSALTLCAVLFALAGCSKEEKAIMPNKTALAAETNNSLTAAGGGGAGGTIDLTTGKVK